jgi:outer membrane protein TolC
MASVSELGRKRISIGALALLVSACGTLPVSKGPEPVMPATWQAPIAVDATTIDAGWWRHYGSAELDRLVEEALAADDNLFQAQLARYTATASLVKTLGGSWSAGDGSSG